jgi:3-hydroxyisobutyrate dehydrogenase
VSTIVAFIGLGQMGRLMAANLAAGGYSVQSYDLDGSGNRKSAKEAADGAHILVTMLPDGAAVRQAVQAALPGLQAGAVVIDMSSADPGSTRDLQRLLNSRQVLLLDAPVSGAKLAAKDGTLSIMVGGDAAVLKHVRPVLEKMGKSIFHCGPLGAGHAMKALNNYVGASGTIAAFEAVVIGRKFGLDPATMVEVLNASTGSNSTTRNKIAQQVLSNAFASGFSAALYAKDVAIAEEMARALGVPSPYLTATSKLWGEAVRRLPRGADHTEMFRFLEQLRPPSRAAAAPRSGSRRKPRRSSAKPARRRRA